MERKYLVAALAMIATFAIFSHGLKSLARYSMSSGERLEARMGAKCSAESLAASAWASKLKTHLRPGFAEEAQLLAEMNLPLAMAQIKVEQSVRDQAAAAQCARDEALRNADQARRNAMKMRDDALKMREKVVLLRDGSRVESLSLRDDMQMQIRRQVQSSMAAAFADQQDSMAMEDSDPTSSASGLTAGESTTHVRCAADQTWQRQAHRLAIDTTRNLVRQIQHVAGSM